MSVCVRTQIEEECKRCCYCLRLLTVRDVPIHFFSRINAHIGPDIIWRRIGPIPTAISSLVVISCFPSILSLRKVHWLTSEAFVQGDRFYDSVGSAVEQTVVFPLVFSEAFWSLLQPVTKEETRIIFLQCVRPRRPVLTFSDVCTSQTVQLNTALRTCFLLSSGRSHQVSIQPGSLMRHLSPRLGGFCLTSAFEALSSLFPYVFRVWHSR